MSLKDFINNFRKPKQRTFVYCPKCNNDLVSSNSFVEYRDGIIKYRCDVCGNVSFWDSIHYPVPLLRNCTYCKHFRQDKFKNGYCKQDCDPDTQIKFDHVGSGCEYCDGAKALTIGKTDDQGIAIHYPNRLNAYGYDIHGFENNGLSVKINYCPMCGRKLPEY